MKIAWITYDFEEYSVLQVNELAKEHEVLLIMPESERDLHRSGSNEKQHSTYALSPQVDHYAFRKPRLRQPVRQLQSVRKILQRVQEFNPDVVHFQQGHMWFNAALGSLKKYPLVITIHDPRHHAGDVVSRKTPQWLMDYGFRQADHVIVHGDALANQVSELFGFLEDHVHVIPHVAMGQTIEQEAEPEDDNLVLFFGRIWDYKGLDQLIAAEPYITAEVPNARIMIAGEGEDFGKYQAQMVNPEHFIVRNAWISDHQRARFFQRSSLVVLPYNEATQSGVVPVAYMYNKPVVATRVGALAECVDDGTTGILVPPRDPESLAAAIVKLLKNRELRHQMGQAGKARLDSECSARVVAAQTTEVYQAAIWGPNGRNKLQTASGDQDSQALSMSGGGR